MPDVLSIIRVRGRGAYFFLPVLSHPASPEKNETKMGGGVEERQKRGKKKV